jgi:polyhydroxybutyrate depolymerase
MKQKNVLLILAVFIANLSVAVAQTATSIIDSVYVPAPVSKFRKYRLYVPLNYTPSNPTPLVFNFHGYTSNAAQQEAYGDFRTIADTANFIIVHPEGEGTPKGFKNFAAVSYLSADISLTSTILDSINAKYNIDAAKVYCTGMSNGGFMTYDLACSLSNKFAAMASVSGIQMQSHLDVCSPSKAMPIMHIHGTADNTVKYNATTGGITPTPPVHVDTIIKWWAKHNNCNLTPVGEDLPNINTADGCKVERYTFAGGDNNSSVILYKVIGGVHAWPGSTLATGAGANKDFNASLEIWKFFRGYTLTAGTPLAINENSKPNNTISVYPNPSAGSFTVTVDNFSNSQLTIVNVLGESVYKVALTKTSTLITMGVPAGVYFYQVTSNNAATTSGKLVIQ